MPKTLCADMYVRAAANYAKTMRKGEHRYPQELHFIDVDTNILDLVKESVKKWRQNPKAIDQRVTVPKYLDAKQGWNSSFDNRRHGGGKGRGSDSSSDGGWKQKGGGRGRDSGGTSNGGGRSREEERISKNEIPKSCQVELVKEDKFKWGGRFTEYKVGKKLVVKVFKGEIAKATGIDAIVCGMKEGKFGLESVGYIADTLKKIGGSQYESKLKKKLGKLGKARNKTDATIFKCKGGNLKVKHVIHVAMKSVVNADVEEIAEYQHVMFSVFEKAKEWDFERIILPLIGTGELCKRLPFAFQTGIKQLLFFCIYYRCHQIKILHQ